MHSSSSASPTVWALTIGALCIFLAADFFMAFKDRHKETTLKKATISVLIYIVLAIAFGTSLGTWLNEQARAEYFAGWITEYSLSFDNLFIFILILARLRVQKEKEELVLLIGIIFSLILRGGFIAVGSVVVNRFEWIFFIFGAFLIYTAIQLFRESDEEEWKEGRAITFLKKRGTSTFLIALTAIALTDLLFAFDSIPAIFGLTRNPYVIVTANVFALMGLRQLYFLIGALMSRLIYLTEGLSIILAFIGCKLIIEAAHSTGHAHILGINLPEISLSLSLGVIIGTLGITTAISLVKSRDSTKSNKR